MRRCAGGDADRRSRGQADRPAVGRAAAARFLARALVNKPDLLVLDEPTVGIDAQTQADFFELIFHMHAHHHMTFLMVSHDIEMIEGRLGSEPRERCGAIKFYVRHSHEQDCAIPDLQHSLI